MRELSLAVLAHASNEDAPPQKKRRKPLSKNPSFDGPHISFFYPSKAKKLKGRGSTLYFF